MADNTVGKINFQVGIDDSKVAAGIARAKATAEAAAKTPTVDVNQRFAWQDEWDKTFNESKVKKTEESVAKVSREAFNLRGIISRIAWPIGLITGGVRIAQSINDANIRLNEFNESVKKIGTEYTKTITALTEKPIDDPIREKRIQGAKEAAQSIAKIQEELLKKTESARLIFERAFFGRLFGAESTGELTRQAQERIDGILADQETLNKKLDKDEADALQKRIDAQAEIERKARDERINENARLDREAFEASLNERERIEYDYNNRLYEANKLQSQATSQFEIDETTKTIAKINAARLKALNDYDRKVQESAKSQTEALTRAFSAAVSSIQKSNAELLPVKDIIFSIEQVREGIAALGRQAQNTGNGFEGGEF